uniref:Sulfotransferase n=1 Tax=Laticauda laticaudata TaxID=8630 RepID=A0A8C5WWP5_LATLA
YNVSRDHFLQFFDKQSQLGRTFMYDGVLYPTMVCCPEILKRIHTFRAREDDIILVSYPKTGSNWVQQILMLLEVASGKYEEDEQKQRLQKLQELSQFFFLEFGEPEKFESLLKISIWSSRFYIYMSIYDFALKILVLLRNPKDTAVSFFHFSKGIRLISDQETWDEYFEAFITGKVVYGSYFDYIVEWNKYLDDSNIFFITYEEIKEVTSSLKKIAKFFDFSVTEEKIESIVKETHFETMKNNAGTFGKVGQILFRKGIVGDWTSVFSESQNEKMDRKFEETVAKTKLGMKLKYEVYCKN